MSKSQNAVVARMAVAGDYVRSVWILDGDIFTFY